MVLTVPVGVARTIMASPWAGGDYAEGSAEDLARNQFSKATEGRYRRHVNASADVYVAMLAAVASVRQVADTAALTKFTSTLESHLQARRATEAREQQEQEREAERAIARHQKFKISQRERTLGPLVEAGRVTALKMIAQTYGIDYADPGVKAALIAAFHEGVYAMNQAANEVIAHVPDADDAVVQAWEQRVASDKRIFELAHERAAVLMRQRQIDTVVYVDGDPTARVVVEPDQWRDDGQARARLIKLRPQENPADPGTWYRSDMVTGG